MAPPNLKSSHTGESSGEGRSAVAREIREAIAESLRRRLNNDTRGTLRAVVNVDKNGNPVLETGPVARGRILPSGKAGKGYVFAAVLTYSCPRLVSSDIMWWKVKERIGDKFDKATPDGLEPEDRSARDNPTSTGNLLGFTNRRSNYDGMRSLVAKESVSGRVGDVCYKVMTDTVTSGKKKLTFYITGQVAWSGGDPTSCHQIVKVQLPKQGGGKITHIASNKGARIRDRIMVADER